MTIKKSKKALSIFLTVVMVFSLSALLSPPEAHAASVEPMVCGGFSHTLALKSDGTVWSWGANRFGQLGDGTVIDRHNPVQVKGPGGVGNLTDVKAIAAGGYHSIAVKSDGTVWVWGYNICGQLGNGTTTSSSVPVQVTGLTNVKAISAGLHFSLALKTDGTVWAWGDNRKGQLGIHSDGDKMTNPSQVKGPNGNGTLTFISDIAAGGEHSLALRNDG